MTESNGKIGRGRKWGLWTAILGSLVLAVIATAACKGSKQRNTFGATQHSEDFSSADALAKWKCYDGGKWEIRDGWLVGDSRGTKFGRSIIWLDMAFVEDLQIEFEAECLDNANDLNCFIGGNGKQYSGYEIIVGGFDNEKVAVYKCAVDGDDASRNRLTRSDFSVEKDHIYAIKVKKYRDEFRVYVDGVEFIRKTDQDPIDDQKHRYFGFSTYKNVVRFDNLKIEKKD